MTDYHCILCRQPITATTSCCGVNYTLTPDTITYDFDPLLYQNFKKNYLLNKILNNNGHLSYLYLPEGSISLDDRADVQSFGQYIQANAPKGKMIDIGCRTMGIPGYLKPIADNPDYTFYGLDPIADTEFKWQKIIGCAEYIPTKDRFFNSVLFATSIDHVCDLEQSIAESHRILHNGGTMILWHAHNHNPLGHFAKRVYLSLKHGYNAFRYVVYHDENVVFGIPNGAIDPFHKEYIPVKKLTKIATKVGFELSDVTQYDHQSYFITYKKP